MGLDNLRSAIPGYARDLQLNLGAVITTSSLDPVMAWGAAAAAALVSKNPRVIREILDEAKAHLDETHLNGVKSAAAIMGMNNVWYKFTDLVQDEEIKRQPAKLRMNVMMNHGGVSQALFEAWSLAASVVNACGVCINAHAAQLRKQEVGAHQVVDIGRIAAVVKAVADTLTFDEAMSQG